MWYCDIWLHCLNLYSFKYRYRRTDWRDNSIINDYLFFYSKSIYFKTWFFWYRWSKREGCNNICYGLTRFLYMPFTLLNGNVKRLASSTTYNSDLCKSLKFVQNQNTTVTDMYSLECFTVYVNTPHQTFITETAVICSLL